MSKTLELSFIQQLHGSEASIWILWHITEYLSNTVGSLTLPSDKLSADVSFDFYNICELTQDSLEEQIGKFPLPVINWPENNAESQSVLCQSGLKLSLILIIFMLVLFIDGDSG